ncbi:MAG: hypothetical protein MK101_09150 [Phycisphaerales bacterium]|nr:hypothetical protein [Phycisphaerales bacterium]
MALIAASVVLSGCTTGETQWPKRSTLTQQQWDRLAEISEQQFLSAEASRLSFTGGTWHLGDIPAGQTILPLLSPDGAHIAVSTGDEPSVMTRLAMPGGPVPSNTSVAIWQVLPGRGGMRVQTELEGPLLLTDSADETGFLVERPNEDGSRWIGKVDWNTGDLTWLVQGDAVAAFPSIGLDGRLAWSERKIDDSRFDLVIRFSGLHAREHQETVIPHGTGNWLLPSWSMRSNRLSAYRLTPDQLQLISLDADSPATLEQDLRSIPIMAGGRPVDALISATARHHVVGTPTPPLEEVFYYDPRQQRMMLWMPTGLNWQQPMLLADQSVACVHDDRGGFLLTLPEGLHWQDRNDKNRLMRLDLTSWIARPTSDPMRPFILMNVANDRITLQAMRPDREVPTAAAESSGAEPDTGVKLESGARPDSRARPDSGARPAG